MFEKILPIGIEFASSCIMGISSWNSFGLCYLSEPLVLIGIVTTARSATLLFSVARACGVVWSLF
ncbi:hypothetical protein [Ruminococcus sp. AM31-15AC]|uniref:hypothetical protein n=1 Tax=Ruminococcus sp. AM31-15AC TaxID=2293202 RepID=UPI0011C11360